MWTIIKSKYTIILMLVLSMVGNGILYRQNGVLSGEKKVLNKTISITNNQIQVIQKELKDCNGITYNDKVKIKGNGKIENTVDNSKSILELLFVQTIDTNKVIENWIKDKTIKDLRRYKRNL